MTVKDLAEWLQAFPDQEAEVLIVRHKRGMDYYEQGGTATTEPFDPKYSEYTDPKYSEYTDFRGSQFVKPDAPYFNRRYLLLGAYNE